MENAGYAIIVLYLLLLIGLPLAVLKPFKAFLIVVFLISAAGTTEFTYARISALGPYFNANDACLIVSIIAMISYVKITEKKIVFPIVTRWIFLVLFIGFFQSWYLISGFHYEVLRSLRYAISMPIYFIVAATMVNSEGKVRLLLVMLFLGSIFSAFEHIFFVRSVVNQTASDISIDQFRTIEFRSPGLWILLSSIVWLPNLKGILNHKMLVAGGSLFAVSVLLNQTRSIWISSIAAIPLVFMLFPQKKAVKRAVIISLLLPVLFIGMLAIIHLATPSIKVDNIIAQRLTTLTDASNRSESTMTRQNDFERETTEWLRSTLVFGCGLVYFAPYYLDYYRGYRVAWGHLGHLSILTQLGIVGLFVFSIYLPIKIIQAARKLWRENSQEIKFLGLLGGMCMVWSWICFFMSDSFLGYTHFTDGIIFGSVWSQVRALKVSREAESADCFSNETAFTQLKNEVGI